MIISFISPIHTQADFWPDWHKRNEQFFSSENPPHAMFSQLGSKTEQAGHDVTSSDPFGLTSLRNALSVLRHNQAFYHELPSPDLSAFQTEIQAFSVLFLLPTGELCLLDCLSFQGGNKTVLPSCLTEFKNAIPERIERLNSVIIKLLPDTTRVEISFDLTKTETHTFILASIKNEPAIRMASELFSAEGTSFEESNATQSDFHSGWSYSCLIDADITRYFVLLGVMIRQQCRWYTLKSTRAFSIQYSASLDFESPIKEQIQLERAIVRRLLRLKIWQHQYRAFEANLKPWTKSICNQVTEHWDIHAETDYIIDTLAQSRDFINNGYNARILLQERRQSGLLFLIAVVGLLGVFSSLSGILFFFQGAEILSSNVLGTRWARLFIIGFFATNMLALAFACYQFFSIQRK